MKRDKKGWIGLFLILMYVSISGSYLNAGNPYLYENYWLFGFFDLIIITCIMMFIPFIWYLLNKDDINIERGKKVCAWNSVIIFILSTLLTPIIGGIGAIFYYYINKWMFVEPNYIKNKTNKFNGKKEEQSEKKETNLKSKKVKKEVNKRDDSIIKLLIIVAIIVIIFLLLIIIGMYTNNNNNNFEEDNHSSKWLAESYVNAVEAALFEELLNDKEVNDGIYTINNNGNLCKGKNNVCDEPIIISSSHTKPDSGMVEIKDKQIVKVYKHDVTDGCITLIYNEEDKQFDYKYSDNNELCNYNH